MKTNQTHKPRCQKPLAMKPLRNKRGQISYAPILIFRFIFILVTVGIILSLTYYLTDKTIDSRQAEATALWTRVMYAPNGIVAQNPFTRTAQPGRIILDHFDNNHLNTIYQHPQPSEITVSAKLELFDANQTRIKTAYINEKGYNRTEPTALAAIKGRGGATMVLRNFTITYKEEQETHWKPGTLRITILLPHETTNS
ncbi:hypothetical protein D6783_05055 [Candidatus Woesearchaeota archaeon]|nr:MAG: hypothetical protein D6783_05055 [Candidatus Woesearchaeota archaeon]